MALEFNKKQEILSCYQEYKNYSMVSRFLKISKTTVIRVVKKYISEKNHLRKAGSGRKRSFGEVETKKIDCLVKKNPQLTSSDIKKH